MLVKFGPKAPGQRGFGLLRTLWRLVCLSILAAVAYGAVYEPKQTAAWAQALTVKLQGMLPPSDKATCCEAVDDAYRRMQDNTLVGLYSAVRLLAAEAAQKEHDVCVRAAQSEAQVALAFAYSTSAQLMAEHAQNLHGASRRAGDRLVREERRQAHEHLSAGQQFAKEAMRMGPIDFVALRAMAAALLQAGRYERARPYLAQCSAALPEDVAVRVLLAQQSARKNPAQGIALLGALLASEPQHNGARLQLALLHLQVDERAAARQDALTILAASPSHTLAQRVLLATEPLALAEAKMNRLTPLPTEAEVAPLLPPVAARQATGQDGVPGASWDKARATTAYWLERGATGAVRAASWCVAHGRPLMQSAFAAAQEQVRLWRAQEPLSGAASEPAQAPSDDVTTLVARAKGQQQRRERDAAERTWQQAALLAPNNVDILVALGWCRLQQHDAAAALKHFERATEHDPQSAEAHFGVAEAKRMAHDVQGAHRGYERYLALQPHGPLAPLCHQMLEESGHEG